MPEGKRKPRKSKRVRSLKACRRCEIGFAPKRKDQVYCSTACREADYNEKYGTEAVTKVCPNCKNEFSTKMPKKQTYCSPECRVEARKKKQDEAAARLAAELQTYGQEVADALANSGYKCTKCGISAVIDGVRLTVVPEGEKLVAVCTECAGDTSTAT